jgi:hypothetical protein
MYNAVADEPGVAANTQKNPASTNPASKQTMTGVLLRLSLLAATDGSDQRG